MKKKIEKFLLDKYGSPDKAHASAVDGKYPFGKSMYSSKSRRSRSVVCVVYSVCIHLISLYILYL